MTHSEHAERARDYVRQADEAKVDFRPAIDIAALVSRAQWHATMAVYEALVLPGYGMSVGDHLEREREDRAG